MDVGRHLHSRGRDQRYRGGRGLLRRQRLYRRPRFFAQPERGQDSEHRNAARWTWSSRSRKGRSPTSRRSRSTAIPGPRTKSSGANWRCRRANCSTWSASSSASSAWKGWAISSGWTPGRSPRDVRPNRKNLVVDVEEKTTGHVSLGAGFSTVDSLVGIAEYNEANFNLSHPSAALVPGRRPEVPVAGDASARCARITR